MKKINVGLLTNIPAPYRLPLFEQLSQHEQFEYTFIFYSITEIGREWKVKIPDEIRYEILNSKSMSILSAKHWDNNPIYFDFSIHRVLMKYNFDVIISGGWNSLTAYYAYLHCRRRNIPYILWSGAIGMELPRRYRFLSSLARPCSGFLIKHADALIAYGTLAKQYLIKMGASPEKIFISFNSVDSSKLIREVEAYRGQRKEIRQKLGIREKRLVLYVGRLIQLKGIIYLLQAFKEVKKNHPCSVLMLVGAGELEAELKQFVASHQIEDVIFYGFVPNDRIAEIYAAADLFVLPTLGDIWGLVINEAMAAGLPIICTSVAGAAQDMVHNNGIIVPPRDASALAQAMISILESETRLTQMSKKSLEIIKDFNIEESSKGFHHAVEFALANSF